MGNYIKQCFHMTTTDIRIVNTGISVSLMETITTCDWKLNLILGH